MTMDLAEFVKARLDDDEAAANAVYGWWRAHGERAIADESYAAILIADVDPETRAFILRFDPARVLREVEAKRRILADYQRQFAERKLHPDDLAVAGALLALHGAVLTLAAIDRDHPDYDPKGWSPDETMRP